MLIELKQLYAIWIAAAAAAIQMVIARIAPRRRVVLQEGDAGGFTARLTGPDKELQPHSFRILNGHAEPPLPSPWLAALRGSHIEVRVKPDHVLFRPVDFPKQAADFLQGMVRAQLDRLTPWSASEAVFGLTAPESAGNDRIALTLAATSSATVQPLIALSAGLGAASVTGLVDMPEAGQPTRQVRLFERQLVGHSMIDVPRMLRRSLVGGALATAAMFAISTYVCGSLDAEQQDLQQRLTQRRAALRLNQGVSSAEQLLAKRKQTTPSSVMVLEALSRALPDSTYATELRVEGDKLQVVGLSQDPPTLVRLLEQSPQFSRATFFAPTTRAPEDPGERFHIEALIKPYFGPGS
jgi:general secretion pathway protein L